MNQNDVEKLLNIKILEFSKSIQSGIEYIHFKNDRHKKVFMKATQNVTDQFLCEKNSLDELSKAKNVKIPKVLFANKNCIVMEALNLSYTSINLERLARSLFSIHKLTHKDFGFYENNFLGLSSQKNTQSHRKWSDFFWCDRLLFKFDQLNEKEKLSSEFKAFFLMLEAINYELLDPLKIQPQLVHGDLWSGNILSLKGGAVALIDPAAYYGHFEVDLAMTQLFGGVGAELYDYYEKLCPLQEGWEKRKKLYNLYHLLNHAVIFSGGYINQCMFEMRSLVDHG